MMATDVASDPAIGTLPASLQWLNPIIVPDLIRLGRSVDGGYVVPRGEMVAADALLSFGLGTDWTFEQDVVRLNPNIRVHVYDHSVHDRRFMEGVVRAWRNYSGGGGAADEVREWVELYESYRGFFQGARTHFCERLFDRPANLNDTTPQKSLERLADAQRLIVKMDIEGGEYRVIDALLAHQQRIRLMIIEFHATEFLRKVFLAKLQEIGRFYEIVHVHGNNYSAPARDGLPDVLEITVLHKSACGSGPRRQRLPVAGLDFPNDPAKPDLEMVFAQT
jgi:hypothetical protein